MSYETLIAPAVALVPLSEASGTVAENTKGTDFSYVGIDPATDSVAGIAPGSIRAQQFDGVNDYVSGPSVSAPAAVTVSMWIHPLVTSSRQYLFRYGRMLMAIQNATTVRWWADVTSGSDDFSYAVAEDADIHLAVTQSGTSAVLYANGVQVDTLTASNAVSTVAGGSFIGRYNSSSNLFEGTFDEFIVIPSALTADEIATLSAGPSSASAMRSHQQLLVPSGY